MDNTTAENRKKKKKTQSDFVLIYSAKAFKFLLPLKWAV